MPTRQTDEFIYTRKTDYYRQPTHEFNLPAGWSCPHADICLTKADKNTGKLVKKPDTQSVGTIPLIPKSDTEAEPYICYAARAERYPNVRDSRWHNYTAARARVHNSDIFEVPKKQRMSVYMVPVTSSTNRTSAFGWKPPNCTPG